MTTSFKTLFTVLLSVLVINTIVTNVTLWSELGLEPQFIILSLWKILLTGMVIVAIKKCKLDTVLAYKKNFWPVLLGSSIIILLSFYNVNRALLFDGQEVSLSLQLWYLCSALSTGGFEEVLFRVFVFNSLYTLFSKQEINIRYLHSIIWTSLLFGGVHMVNLLKSDYDLFSVISQIIIAFGIGVLFQSLLIKYKNILVVITLHGLFNYFGMYRFYLYTNTDEIVHNTVNDYLNSLVLTIVFAASISLIGFLLIRKNISKETSK
ncbi:lysostaphin resistance A-like protein [Aquimarina sp. SS2-1]|uniref:CPBP family intramembrane glutamic endopeptidase n=1 Tax=Aquimarina besae TaxID=3342247 RepID=UPI003671CC86